MDSNIALVAESDHKTAIESAEEYIENFDILETITNVGNDEVFTPAKTCKLVLDNLPDEVWHNPSYKWLNPASKNGIFEREIAIRLDDGLKNIMPDDEKRKKHILQNMIYSLGQTKFTANVARRTLYYCSEANRKCDGEKADDGHYVNGYAIGNGSWFDTTEGNIITPTANHQFEGNKKDSKCIYCGLRENSKYVDPLQREQYAYEFIHTKTHKMQQLINSLFNGGNEMKIDIIIGNPPYQLSDGGGKGTSALPIYQHFVERAIELNPKYISFIIPARWYSGGKGLDDFRKRMLNDNRIKLLYDFSNYKDCFPSLGGLAGGACFFLWDRDYDGECKVINHGETVENTTLRKLNQYDVLVRSNRAVGIVNKVMSLNYKRHLNDVIYPRLPFNIPTNYTKASEKGDIPCYFTQKLGLLYVDKNDVKDYNNILKKWKFLIPKAPIAGQTDFSKPVGFYYEGNTRIARPGEICSESWLVAGAFDTKEEANNYKSYILTKTVRFLLLQTIVSQNTSRENFCFIPDLEKYDRQYDDAYLIKKWGISSDEWEYIDSRIHNYGKDDIPDIDEVIDEDE